MRTGGGKGEALSVDTRSLQPHPVEGERPALWDPVNALPSARKWIWALLAVYVLIAQGPTFLRNIPGRWDGGNDFFQDWTSARNVLEGRPAYLPLSEAAALHGPKLGGRPAVIPRLPWNAHPPTSVLATLPLALLDYLDAVTISTHSSPCTFGWCFCCDGRSPGPGRRPELLRGRVAWSRRGKAARCPRSLARDVGAYRGVSIFVYTRRAVHRKNH